MRIILDTDNEQNFIDLWNPEKTKWERYIKYEEKEETKTTTRESIEALGYACGEIQKCFTNGWEKSLKNKSLIEEDKKIEKLNTKDLFACDDYQNIKLNFGLTWSKINEIIGKINGGTND